MQTLLKSYTSQKQNLQSRLKEFSSLPEKDYIKEHVFCLLTPQSQAKKCWQAVEEIFVLTENERTEEKIREILSSKTRFHNTKAKRVVAALENWEKTKSILSNQNILELRNSLAEKINGYGLKEAGHFLRNIGLSQNKIAILDRHILRNLHAFKIIEEEKIKNKKHYLEIENSFLKFSEKVKIPVDELDLLWWSQENGEIFK